MKNIGIIIELESDSGKVKKTCFGMITLAREKNSALFAFVVNADIKTLKPDLESFGITNIVDIVIEPEHQHNPVVIAKTTKG